MTTVTILTAATLLSRNSSATAAIMTFKPARLELNAAMKNNPKNKMPTQ